MRRCIGVHGFPCEKLAEPARKRCTLCRITTDVSHEMGRPIVACTTCAASIVQRDDGRSVCLGCDEIAVFGAELAGLASTPARDVTMAMLAKQVLAGTMDKSHAVIALREHDAAERKGRAS